MTIQKAISCALDPCFRGHVIRSTFSSPKHKPTKFAMVLQEKVVSTCNRHRTARLLCTIPNNDKENTPITPNHSVYHTQYVQSDNRQYTTSSQRKQGNARRNSFGSWMRSIINRGPKHISLVRTHSMDFSQTPNNNLNISDKDLPPKVLWSFRDEFPVDHIIDTIVLKYRIIQRITKLASERILTGQTALNLTAFGAGVYFLGCIEAILALETTAVDMQQALHFINAYAAANMVPSCVWSSVPLETVAESIGQEPTLMLGLYGDPAKQVIVANISAIRSILAGFGVLSQVLRIVNLTMQAGTMYQERILSGSEPIIDGVSQRIIRLCGRDSQTTTTSLRRYAHHMLPVIEDQNLAKDMFWRCSQYVTKFQNPFDQTQTAPLYLHVPKGHYGTPSSWACLQGMDKDFLLQSTTGRQLLCMEADGTSATDPLGLIKKQGDDLTVENATQAFKQIERLANRRGLRYRSLRVFLGNQRQEFVTGGGTTYSLRDRVISRNEIDIVIDAGAPILREILTWCQKVNSKRTKEDKKKKSMMEQFATSWKPEDSIQGTIVLETESANYYEAVSSILEARGMNILDVGETDIVNEQEINLSIEKNDVDIQSENKIFPRIIMYKHGDAAVNAVYALIDTKLINVDQLCVVVPNEEAAQVLNEIKESTQQQFKVICASHVYDDLYRQVRVWARLGYSSKSIQQRLDMQYGYFYQG